MARSLLGILRVTTSLSPICPLLHLCCTLRRSNLIWGNSSKHCLPYVLSALDRHTGWPTALGPVKKVNA